MNSGRRNGVPFVLYDDSNAPFGKIVILVMRLGNIP
jgi:hypothetical protein